ncbi:MAG: DUF3604 domain-containing protein, partial [Halioglobus sp.]|nr:DUF3604 domain-containing protein [Halioglobus sp.]
MLPRLIKITLVILALLVAGAIAIGAGVLGRHEGPGEITGNEVPASVIRARAARQSETRAALAIDAPRDILFGDFHTHTTLSMDAFLTSLPFAVGEGSHPQADACDFARYCSALDFWSINDHAEFLTPRRWRETVESIRDCNARAGDPDNPDVVAFLGWEWTNIGTAVNNHWGHKNVVLRDLEDAKIPARAIQASPTRATDLLETLNFAARTAMAIMFLGEQRIQDFAKYAFEGELYDACADDVHVQDLPADCRERAATPEVLLRKLREWDVNTLVIPHGNTWGIYTPAGAGWDKQLHARQHDPKLQTLFEVYSGHGNTEEYRDWRGVAVDSSGKRFCPAPTKDYVPVCWRAGEIIQERCMTAGEAQDECAQRAALARANYLAAPTLQGEATVPQAQGQDWLDAGQCRDCFQPAWYYRPAGSAQYALALTNFEEPENPQRFRFGFIGSSDVHTARPGTGYKEYDRFYMADFQLPLDTASAPAAPSMPPARSIPWEEIPEPSMFSNDGLVDDRVGAFYQTGGLVATHSTGRDRGSIWAALQRREVYATSGQRTLLWFDLLNAPGDTPVLPMGTEVAMPDNPQFRVRAAGSFRQQP